MDKFYVIKVIRYHGELAVVRIERNAMGDAWLVNVRAAYDGKRLTGLVNAAWRDRATARKHALLLASTYER